MDNAEPAPVNRFLREASNSGLPSFILLLSTRVAYTKSPMVARAAMPIRRGIALRASRSSLMIAWRSMVNSSP
ncbi:hypothetical protein D3C80_1994730 [compost metagenome]